MTPATAATPRTLTLGHSPDPDDAFMFYGLACGAVKAEGLRFEHILQDIQTLNERATRGELDISAISIHAYASVLDQYALLPCGASMGDNYGPMIVAREAFDPTELRTKRIAIPGLMTSAFLAFRLYLAEQAEGGSVPRPQDPGPRTEVVPFDQIIDHVLAGRADCGLIIHEGQLTYRDADLAKIVDLGEWWFARTGGLPLPLGANVVRKSLGHPMLETISRVLRESIDYGLAHREEALLHSMQWGRGLDRALADRFVGMYVNELTLDFGERGRRAVELFLSEAHARGFIAAPVALEFVGS